MPHDRVVEWHVGGGRKPLDPVAAAQDRRLGEPHEDRLREMGMAHHQLADRQRREFALRGRCEHLITRGRQLVHVHAPEYLRARVPDHATVDLRPELFGAEEHQAEVATALGDVEQHLLDVGVRPIPRCVLVQLIHEDHHGIDAELASLELLAQPRDYTREDEVLAERIDVGDVDHVDRAIFELRPGQIARRPVVRHEPLAPRRDVEQAVAHLTHGGDVMRPPGVAAPPRGDLETIKDRAKQAIEIGKALHAMGGAEAIVKRASHDPIAEKIDERVGFGVDIVAVE